jgi:hypothetical protein
MILDSFTKTKSGVPHPEDWSTFPHPLWTAAGVRSWASFVKGAVSCDVYREQGEIKIMPMRNTGRQGGFAEVKENEQVLVDNSSPEALGAAVRKALHYAASSES